MQQPFITWFTQPTNALASFYYFDIASKTLVRIRLELNRKAENGDTGNTGIFVTPDRRVGFYDGTVPANQQIQNAHEDKFSTNTQGAIVFNGNQTFDTTPTTGFTVCDFSGAKPANFNAVHIGNVVEARDKAVLPPGIDEPTLELVAKNAIAKSNGKPLVRDLTVSTASIQDVANALKTASDLAKF